VVELVKNVTNDRYIITATYLHDVLEDTDTTYTEIKNKFGKKVADLVKEVTKKGYNYFPHLKSRDAILIKYADRLSNLSQMKMWSPQKKQKYLEKSIFWRSKIEY
jgi:(p)ppGpp synthase/HD superfamily hydrolase